MQIDVADLFKYGWMLLLTIIPRHLSSMNARFKTLEARDMEIYDSVTALKEEVAVVNTKLGVMESRLEKMGITLDKTLEIITELRIITNNKV